MLLAAMVYVLGALVPTFAVNVPMNDALAAASIPSDPQQAAALWTRYSADWTWWNHLRLIFSMIGLLLVGSALFFGGRSVR